MYAGCYPMQVVSAGAQTDSRVVNPCYTSGVSHAQQQMFTRHLLSHIILRYAAVFNPAYESPVHRGRETQLHYQTNRTVRVMVK